jgi:N-acetylneuraminic acid mutarotase
MPTARTGLTVSVVDGKIYAIGGCNPDGGQSLGKVEVYDPVTDTWTTKTPMPTPRRLHCAAVVNGIIYVIGSDATWRKVEAFDPATDTWMTKTNMPTGRGGLSCAVVNGKIYVMGGTHSPNWPSLKTVEEYNPATDSWITKADMHTGRYNFSASVVDGIIYAIGGQGTGQGLGGQLSTVEAYDPATDTWEQKQGLMSTSRADVSACTVNDTIFAIGGFRGGTILSTVEAYDPANDTFTEKTSMPNPRMQVGVCAVQRKSLCYRRHPILAQRPGPFSSRRI